jgi:hypothetical protein
MSDSLRRVQDRARELARSGLYAGWRPIAFELRFEPGYSEAAAWINSHSTQDEIDALCLEARAANRRASPEAA